MTRLSRTPQPTETRRLSKQNRSGQPSLKWREGSVDRHPEHFESRYGARAASKSDTLGIEKARALWQKAGLDFPTIPEELKRALKERGPWLFSTRALPMSPYNLQYYLEEAERKRVKRYAVLAHSGHGVNSYAIQYYLLYRRLRLFLHLGWGGVYMDNKVKAANIRSCFSTADKIVALVRSVFQPRTVGCLTIVGSDFYGSYWLRPDDRRKKDATDETKPLEVLTDAFAWLKSNEELTE